MESVRPVKLIELNEDPVCGMAVDPTQARAKGRVASHAGIDYVSCAKGCLLGFGDEPKHYLDPSYSPTI